VEFATAEGLAAAVALDGAEVEGRRLLIARSAPPAPGSRSNQQQQQQQHARGHSTGRGGSPPTAAAAAGSGATSAAGGTSSSGGGGRGGMMHASSLSGGGAAMRRNVKGAYLLVSGARGSTGHMRQSLQLHNAPPHARMGGMHARMGGMVPWALVTTSGVRSSQPQMVGAVGKAAAAVGGGGGAPAGAPKTNADFKKLLLEGR